MATEFNLSELDRDILVAAALLHDIGTCDITRKGRVDGWKYFDKTGWSRDSYDKYNTHPILSASVIGMNPFEHSTDVQALVSVHMSHWNSKTCPTPDALNARLRDLARLLCLADYLASKKEVALDQK